MKEAEIRDIFGSNLKRYRNYCKLSQAELAEKLDISIPFLSDVENGRKWISPINLVKIASALNIEPYELFKPADALPSEMPLILNKCIDDAVVAVTQTLNQIRSHYLPKAEASSKN